MPTRRTLTALLGTAIALTMLPAVASPATAAPLTWDDYVDATYDAFATSGGARFRVTDSTTAPRTVSELRVDGTRSHYSARTTSGPTSPGQPSTVVDGVGYSTRTSFLAIYGPTTSTYTRQVSAQTTAIAGRQVAQLVVPEAGPRTAIEAAGTVLLDCRTPGATPANCPAITVDDVLPGELAFHGTFEGSSDTILGSALLDSRGALIGVDLVLLFDGQRYDWGWSLARGHQTPTAPSGARYDAGRMVRALAARGIPPIPGNELPWSLRAVGSTVQSLLSVGRSATPVRTACHDGAAAVSDELGGVWRSQLLYTPSAYVCRYSQRLSGAVIRVSVSRTSTLAGRPRVTATTYAWGAVRLRA